eukprot:TRINITY_DN12893_c0_g1_i1.p1 TRINITY_DN12893_c0_g1~~TRINITY_DN12893_c0_g1_i1.p1  ORF type:complete len:401 (-),score=45.64 TRINITY_DN12893_c0_g1_i1:47-1249(-)
MPRESAIGAHVLCQWPDQSQHMCEIIAKRLGADKSVEYYVHFIDQDRRLDTWVTNDAFVLPDALSPSAEAAAAEETPVPQAQTPTLLTRNMKRKFSETHHTAEEPLDPVVARMEKEREEATKVKNVHTIVIGRYEIDCWYFSPYPAPCDQANRLYLCEFCLKYMRKETSYRKHVSTCIWKHPPGAEIYRNGNLSMFEVDGKSTGKIYCQNLCLLAKLFLDHKTLYFDVEPFLFYVLTENDEQGSHLVGYFSKEKFSPDDYNVACILTLPPYQRKGYGRFLMAMSYELSKKENKSGTPERPLSDMGLISYRAYWSDVLLEVLKNHRGNLSIKDLSQLTAMKPDDIVSTLSSLNLVRFWKGQHIISVSRKVLDEHLKTRTGSGIPLDPSRLKWVPKYTKMPK